MNTSNHHRLPCGDISYGERLAVGAVPTFVLRKSVWDWILSNLKTRQKTSALLDLRFSFFSLCIGISMIIDFLWGKLLIGSDIVVNS
jgi:hypothetical protein